MLSGRRIFFLAAAFLLTNLLPLQPGDAAIVRTAKQEDWESWGTSYYMFILDTERRADETHHNAERKCKIWGGGLVSIETEDELAYIVRRIEKHVILIGQEFAHEQWWTSGFRQLGVWHWDNGNKTQVALPSLEPPKPVHSSVEQYIALSHDQDGWRFVSFPDNFKLRYICEKVNYNAHARPPEEQLVNHLFQNYDRETRGYSGQGRTVNVTIRLNLLRIQELDESRQVLTTLGLIIAEWTDERLRWMPDLFDDISSLMVRADRLWLPELTVINGVEEHIPGDLVRMRVVLSPTGRVHWEPGGVLQSTCDVDMRYFPFDQQDCSIKVGAWAYYSTKLNLTSVSPVIETGEFTPHGEWHLISASAEWKQRTLSCCPDISYPYVEFKLGLKRRHVFHVINIVLPCVLLSLMVMALFWVPPSAGEKITGGVAVLCAFTVFLLLLSEIVPRTSLHIPIIVIYLACTMGLGTLSVCCNILVLSVSNNSPQTQPPKWLVMCFRLPRTLYESVEKTPELLYRRESDDIAASADSNLAEKGNYSSEEECAQNSINRKMAESCKLSSLRNAASGHGAPSSEDVNKCRPASASSTPDYLWRLLAKRLDRMFFCIVFVLFVLNVLVVLLAPWHQTL